MSTYTSPICSINSCNVELSSRFAHTKHPTSGNGKFEVLLSNASRVTQGVKVTPTRVWIPNVFNNINEHTQKVTVLDAAGTTVIQTETFTNAFYSRDEYITEFNARFIGVMTMTFTGVPQNKIQLTAAAAYHIAASVDWFDMVGLHTVSEAYPPTFHVDGLVAGHTTRMLKTPAATPTPAFTLSTIPNFGGPTLVHLHIHGMCDGNQLCADAVKRDIMLTIPLVDTAYGFYYCNTATDIWVDDFEHRVETDLSHTTVELLDSKYRPLYVPENYDVTVILKLYHMYTSNG